MSKKILLIASLLFFSIALTSCAKNKPDQNEPVRKEILGETNQTTQSADQKNQEESKTTKLLIKEDGSENKTTNVILKTSKGDITLFLYKDVAPKTVSNFLQKAESGFYTGLKFHRVESWVAQGGDPLGNGSGGKDMQTELSKKPFKPGSLGVARGPNIEISNDSQFFICTDECSWLTAQYTNFGEVTKGMDVAKSISVGDKILGIEIQN